MTEEIASPVDALDVSVFTIPTEEPEADGTFMWTSTTVVVAETGAAGTSGLGFTYGTAACATLSEDVLRDHVVGTDPMDVPAVWGSMVRAIGNQGRPGVASMAIAAVDVSLWDLKAKLLDLPLASLLGRIRKEYRCTEAVDSRR